MSFTWTYSRKMVVVLLDQKKQQDTCSVDRMISGSLPFSTYFVFFSVQRMDPCLQLQEEDRARKSCCQKGLRVRHASIGLGVHSSSSIRKSKSISLSFLPSDRIQSLCREIQHLRPFNSPVYDSLSYPFR